MQILEQKQAMEPITSVLFSSVGVTTIMEVTNTADYFNSIDDFFNMALFMGFFSIALASAAFFGMLASDRLKDANNIREEKLKKIYMNREKHLSLSASLFISACIPCMIGLLSSTLLDTFDTGEITESLGMSWQNLFAFNLDGWGDELAEAALGFCALGWAFLLFVKGLLEATKGLKPVKVNITEL
jgi:hypothetical protein